MILDKTKDIKPLLSFFDAKQYNIEEVSDIIYKLFSIIKEKNQTKHQAGCTWSIMMIYKKSEDLNFQLEELVDEFFEYVKGYDKYFESLELWGSKEDCEITYYNEFINKKIRGV